MYADYGALIRLARVTNTSADDGQIPVQQVSDHGKLSNVAVLMPYGLHANMTIDTLVTLLALNGDTSNAVAIGGYTKNRPKMAAGENCIFHPPTGAIIHFKEDGNIYITPGNSRIYLDGNLTVTGDITCNGDITCDNLEAAQEVEAGDVTLTGHTHAYTWTDPAGDGTTDPGEG